MGGARSCPICSYSPLSQVSQAVIHPCKLLLFGSRCKSTFNVDKQDFQEIDNISCPLPWCNYTWCKLCQQSISANGPKHSCDGLSEMMDLIKRSGWKYCPSKLGYRFVWHIFLLFKKIHRLQDSHWKGLGLQPYDGMCLSNIGNYGVPTARKVRTLPHWILLLVWRCL